ncbi:arginine--tRNA ligase [Fibrella sp. HMF5335]|uniref:Arginine--tRNA ligase n=1 Tax=Fibrella rubiginis TaxID=2817060 RepID=A0A939GFG0_9BACT|nr:arginine--tRNA ligase [Fibrella rubiginis]MBO0935736.1 arginine--tRNA ligase [Fibrella rubiginis]
MDLQASLKTAIQQAIQSLYTDPSAAPEPGEVLLQPTKKEFEGTYTYVTFPLTKPLRLSPVEIGQRLGNWLVANSPLVRAFNVVQGFLNISLADIAYIQSLNALIADGVAGAQQPDTEATQANRVMVEFSSPNTNKPLHLGHLRNIFLGDSVSRILAANGYTVTKACLVNDRGIHICKSMLAYQKFGRQPNGTFETPESAGLKGDHLIGKYYVLFDKAYKAEVAELVAGGMAEDEAAKKAPLMLQAQEMLLKWEQGDAETVALWEQLNAWVYAGFAETYRKTGISFDKTYYESQTYLLGKDVVEEGLVKGIFYQKEDKSVWIDLTAEGLDHKLVLRGDGTSVYITQDLGTTDLKFSDFHSNKSLWVVGNEQDYHFKVLFAIMKRLGRPYAEGCYHLSYGMVDLPSGKMKSREGTVVDADDLVDEVAAVAAQAAADAAKGKLDEFSEAEKQDLFRLIGLGALKYYLLKVDPQKRMLFNPAESVDVHGHTGPFIQYVHARIRSIMRKAEEAGLSTSVPADEATATADRPLHETEQEVIVLLGQFAQSVANAGRDYAPSYVAQYVYDLAKAYNRLFADVSILSEPDAAKTQLRLSLSAVVAETIRKGMGLLGIEVPEKM